MQRMTWILPVLAIAGIAPGCHPVDTGNAVERELRTLDQQWAEFAVRGDVAAFDRLMTDDHVAIHANGKLVTNAEERTYLASSPGHIASITTDDVGIRVY